MGEFSAFFYDMFTQDFEYINIDNVKQFCPPIFFVCYILLITLILLKLYVLINDNSLKRVYYNVLKSIGLGIGNHRVRVKKIEYVLTADDISLVLTRLRFTQFEIGMYFALFDIPTQQIEEMMIDVDALEAELDENPEHESTLSILVRIKTGLEQICLFREFQEFFLRN